MSDIADCRAMELLCRQRAKADPENSWKWLGQAERWHELGRNQIAWRFQQRNNQQMHAGPMAMGPNTVNGDTRFKQLGWADDVANSTTIRIAVSALQSSFHPQIVRDWLTTVIDNIERHLGTFA
jgi:hypothetical protein